MKKLITTFLLLTAFLFSSVSPLFSQNYQELYQEALIKEEGEGSLLEAIDIYNSGDFYGTFYNPDGTADLRNSGDFYGSIVANDIICHNSSKFHYDRNLGKKERDEIEDMEVIAWREVF